ncbi:MAG: ferredoxin [Candidatus Latescibacteria bacterium]|nr:ferredoxin [Candidatus Latescibacterota bacterium]NIO01019.1 ferredoxin [Candidatus Latescibacterota bacterium]NIO27418.1 ferredoxin [Candidatus Latescibacterota bacterium]NIO54940.1 ferredoxin [Candidatus Latescibacterota bacterium]NIT01029.1 ferredoxin [Candidatus Latescibacterota bacterium]
MESKKSSLVTTCRLTIDLEKCLSCAACPPVCHTGALNLSSLLLEINKELCDNCSICIKVCPTGALLFSETTNFKPQG